MAERMNEILKANPGEKIVFAAGNSHWLIGSDSLEVVLKEYGYSLERLEDWKKYDAQDFSNEQCGVVLDLEEGYYVPVRQSATSRSAFLFAESMDTHLNAAELEKIANGEMNDVQGSQEEDAASSSSPASSSFTKLLVVLISYLGIFSC